MLDVAPAATAEQTETAHVSVDFANASGPRKQTERLNNFSDWFRYAEQRPSDVNYLNAQGLHGKIYRVWLDDVLRACLDPKTCALSAGIQSYLRDASNVSDSIMINLDGRPLIESSVAPADYQAVVARTLAVIKQAYPKVTYLEVWNEPDSPYGTVASSAVYATYKPFYQAVNELNRSLAPGTSIRVGGPAFFWFDTVYLEKFLDDYVADTDPGKRLDFISYHGYLSLTKGLYKDDPSGVAGERSALEGMLQQRHLSTDIPTYVTETGVYPGPLCDACDSTDYARGAAGVASIDYWYADQPDTYRFNWVVRHQTQGLKDEFVTRDSTGSYWSSTGVTRWGDLNPIPTETFTPAGNLMKMQSMMKNTEVAAQSDSLSNGTGVYARASKDDSGVSTMVWNYQPYKAGAPAPSFTTKVSMANLPASLSGHAVIERAYLIDQQTSNYFANPATSGLQQVSSTMTTFGPSHSLDLELKPNAIYLVVAASATTVDCKADGWKDFGFRNQGQCVSYVNTGHDSRS